MPARPESAVLTGREINQRNHTKKPQPDEADPKNGFRKKLEISQPLMNIDLNCDLGEGESVARTRSLMRCITSANVACGGHAGTVDSMQTCVRLAKQFGVRLGAHPGPWNRNDFGRRAIEMTPDDLELLLLQQVGALDRLARAAGVRLHHIKLHGALYHASELDEALGRRYVTTVARWWPQAKIFSRAGGKVARHARRSRVEVWEEGFADRVYLDDGNLAPRSQPNALLTDVRQVMMQAQGFARLGQVASISGRQLRLTPQTLCVHSDTPHALEIVRAVSTYLQNG